MDCFEEVLQYIKWGNWASGEECGGCADCCGEVGEVCGRGRDWGTRRGACGHVFGGAFLEMYEFYKIENRA